MESKIKKFGLIGNPLGHSISPAIHKELLKIKNLEGNYELIEIIPEELKNAYKTNLVNLDGFNITIPHKVSSIFYMNELSEKGKLFGSINTVKVENGILKGYNTDYIGFLKAIESDQIPLKGDVLILGSGGVSRMFAFEAALAGCNITLAIRDSSKEKALKIKQELNKKLSSDCEIIDINNIEKSYDLIINGTPVGMFPNIDNCPVSEEVIKNAKYVYDAIYNPLETKFIKLAKKNNVKALSGLSMLVWQAAAAEEIWNNVTFSKEEIEKVIEIVEKLI